MPGSSARDSVPESDHRGLPEADDPFLERLPPSSARSRSKSRTSGNHSDSDDDDDGIDLFSQEERVIEIENGVSQSSDEYCNNVVITSRYTAWNFLPKNLFEQFSELANLYFLFIGLLQIVPQISTTQGLPTIYMPLAFIVFVSAIRAAVEDYHRHKADEATSSTPYLVYSREGRGFHAKRSGDIGVGDVVMVRQDETVPADMLLLSSSDARNGQAFIDKKSLNGETSLEIVLALRETFDVYNHPDAVSHLRCRLATSAPDGTFDHFAGRLELFSTKDEIMRSAQYWSEPLNNRRVPTDAGALPPSELPQTTTVPLHAKTLLLRETTLRSTDWVMGVVVYTGRDTKIRQNVFLSRLNRKWWQKTDIKKTRVFQLVDRFLLWMLIAQTVLCLVAGVFAGIWRGTHGDSWYLRFPDSAMTTGVLSFFSFFIILSQMVPISLIVSAELVKMFLSLLIEKDHSMYSRDKDEAIQCNKSTIHEDLGQVDYVLSDKTGTLTKNKMEFRFALVMGVPGLEAADSSPCAAPRLLFDDAPADQSAAVRALSPGGLASASAQPASPTAAPSTSADPHLAPAPAFPAGVLCFGKMETEMSKRAQAREAEYREEQQARREGRRVRPRPAHLWTELVSSMHDKQLRNETAFPHKQQILDILWGTRQHAPPTRGLSGTASRGLADEAESVYSTNPPQFDPVNPDLPWNHPLHTHARDIPGAERQRLYQYLLNCALSNTATPYHDAAGSLQYTTESADELALVLFARDLGVVLCDRDPNDPAVSYVMLEKGGRGADQLLFFRRLGTFHFTSERKRVTAVYEQVRRRERMVDGKKSFVYTSMPAGAAAAADPDSEGEGEVMVMCKGQDTVLMELLHNPRNDWARVQRAMQHMCKAGLRTMLLAEARRPRSWWTRVQAEYEELEQLCLDRTRRDGPALRERLDDLKTRIERDAELCLLGASGLEDELQELVPECIGDMLRAGMKVWMLTGDKKETAKNIALACCLIDPDMLPDLESLTADAGDDQPVPARVSAMVRGSRVLEVTGEWASLAQDPAVMSDLFRYFATARGGEARLVSYEDMLALLAGLGVDEGEAEDSAGTGHPLGQSLRVVFDVYDEDRDGRIDFEQFCAFMRQVQVSPFEAVAMDVARGLQTAREMTAKGLAVSMLVTKEAFAVICPPARIVSQLHRHEKLANSQFCPPAFMGGGSNSQTTPGFGPMSPGAGPMSPPMSPLAGPMSPASGPMSPSAGPLAPAALPAALSPHQALLDPRVTRRQRTALRYDFFRLAALCRSVVFAGAEPPMKERMVRELSERCRETMQHPQDWHYAADCYETVPDADGNPVERLRADVPAPPDEVEASVTLAVGDGANDELMIKAAHVGVGISGVEGSAAVKAADYATAQFAHLHTLLLVHGAWCYHRIAYLVYFVFYKAALVALTMFFFGFFSGFSGQQLFNEPIYQFFNIMFTALPVLCLCTVDRVLDRNTLENNPEVYRSLRTEPFFSLTAFCAWLLRAFGHAGVIFFVGFLSLSVNNVSHEDGREHGLYLVAAAIYMAVVLLATFLIVLDMASVTWLHAFSVVFSVASFFLVVILFSVFEDFNVTLYGIVLRMLASPTVWLVVSVTTLIPLLIDVCVRHFVYVRAKTLVELLREQQVQQRQRADLLEALRHASPAVRFSRMQEFDKAHPALPDLRLYKGFAQTDAAAPGNAKLAGSEPPGRRASTSASAASVDRIADILRGEGADDDGEAAERRAQMQRAVLATMLRFRNLTGSYFESAQWQAGTEHRSRDYTVK